MLCPKVFTDKDMLKFYSVLMHVKTLPLTIKIRVKNDHHFSYSNLLQHFPKLPSTIVNKQTKPQEWVQLGSINRLNQDQKTHGCILMKKKKKKSWFVVSKTLPLLIYVCLSIMVFTARICNLMHWKLEHRPERLFLSWGSPESGTSSR